MLVASSGHGRGMFSIPGDRRGGLIDRPFAAASKPISQWIGKTRAAYGRPVSTTWRVDSADGVDLYGVSDKHARPGLSSESITWLDDLTCQIAGPGQISPIGWTVPGAMLRTVSWAMMSIESVIAGLVVDVLDDQGAIVETVEVDGSDPCTTSVVHPDPDVDPLTWRFRLTAREISLGEVSPVAGIPSRVLGRDLIDAWADARYGTRRRYRTTPQIVVGTYAAGQVWVTLTGPSDRYRVRVTTGLEGFSQNGGPHGAAIKNSEFRN